MRILIVEDEEAISNLIRMSLCKTGYICEQAFDGETAADLIAENSYDLILLDIMLPGMDGFSLCETIRHGDPYIGIIMASAKGQESDKIRGLSIGADDYKTI